MNHDIIHCFGGWCPLKEDCLRYKVYLERKNVNNGRHKGFSLLNYNIENKFCAQLIWKELEKINMNHDIIHCDGFDCPLRDNCYRYLAHLELKKLHIMSVPFDYMVSNYDSKTKKCNFLWKKE